MTDLVFQQGDTAPRQLIVMLHGVGSSARDMAPLGQALAEGLAEVRVVVADGFDPFDLGGNGRQWFSVRGVTPENRAGRVASAMPRLLDRIEALRLEAGLDPASVGLFGFSQGAIMALAAAAGGYAVGRVVSAAGRLAAPGSTRDAAIAAPAARSRRRRHHHSGSGRAGRGSVAGRRGLRRRVCGGDRPRPWSERGSAAGLPEVVSDPARLTGVRRGVGDLRRRRPGRHPADGR